MRPHDVLVSLETINSTFYGDALFHLVDGLDVLMGGRGTGKTTVINFIRYVMDCPIPAYYAKAFDAHIEDLLGPGTAKVRCTSHHGVEYTVSRAYGEPRKVYNAAGKLVDVPLEELFGIELHGAKELERIADSPEEQLALLDRFAIVDTRRLSRALEDVERRIAQSGADVDRLSAAIASDEERGAELSAVEEALKALALGDPGGSDELGRAEARRPVRGREQNAMKGLSTEVGRVRAALDLFAREGQRLLVGTIEGDLERSPEPLGAVFHRAHRAVHGAAGAIEAMAGRLRGELAHAEEALAVEARALAAVHDAEDESYKALVVRRDSDKERAVERERLHRRRDELAAAAKQTAERRRERDRRSGEHDALMKERASVLEERHALRCRLACEISEAVKRQVVITVKRGGLGTGYLALLSSIFEKSGVSKELLAWIAEGIPPEELFALATRQDPAPIIAVDPAKTEKGKPARAHKVIDWLRESGRLREIEIAPLDDLPVFELLTDMGYQETSRVSTGQKCSAALPLLLLPSVKVLIIDQIEDHLDAPFVFGVLVPTLLAAKGSRQFILASHSANVIVLGDADRVFELAVKNDQGYVPAFGNVDEMRERIERVVEGGKEAFLRRGERYGHLPPRGPKEEESGGACPVE